MQDRDTLELIGTELSKDRGVTVDVEGGLHSFDDLGYRIGFRITSREIKPLVFPNSDTVGKGSRVNKRADVFARKKVIQQRMFHVVYWVPGNTQKYANFDLERRGFRLTESIKGSNFFMRCGASNDHRNLFLETRDNNFGFQYMAY